MKSSPRFLDLVINILYHLFHRFFVNISSTSDLSPLLFCAQIFSTFLAGAARTSTQFLPLHIGAPFWILRGNFFHFDRAVSFSLSSSREDGHMPGNASLSLSFRRYSVSSGDILRRWVEIVRVNGSRVISSVLEEHREAELKSATMKKMKWQK